MLYQLIPLMVVLWGFVSHLMSNCWGHLYNLFEFRLFACVFFGCSALSSLGLQKWNWGKNVAVWTRLLLSLSLQQICSFPLQTHIVIDPLAGGSCCFRQKKSETWVAQINNMIYRSFWKNKAQWEIFQKALTILTNVTPTVDLLHD